MPVVPVAARLGDGVEALRATLAASLSKGEPNAGDWENLALSSEELAILRPIGDALNGDTAAGAIAGALKADRLLLLTDVEGVKDKDGAVLTEINALKISDLIADGTIAGGMIPKTETATKAIKEGVRAVVILDGRAPNACLLELFTDHGAGSLIR